MAEKKEVGPGIIAPRNYQLTLDQILQGFLKKQGEKGLFKSFKLRWFSFEENEGKLYYSECYCVG